MQPEISGIERRILESRYDFEQSNEHATRQLCVNRSFSLNKSNKRNLALLQCRLPIPPFSASYCIQKHLNNI